MMYEIIEDAYEMFFAGDFFDIDEDTYKWGMDISINARPVVSLYPISREDIDIEVYL